MDRIRKGGVEVCKSCPAHEPVRVSKSAPRRLPLPLQAEGRRVRNRRRGHPLRQIAFVEKAGHQTTDLGRSENDCPFNALKRRENSLKRTKKHPKAD